VTEKERQSLLVGEPPPFRFKAGASSTLERWRLRSRLPVVSLIRQLRGEELTVRAVMRMVKQEPTLQFDHRFAFWYLAELGPDASPALERSVRDRNALARYLSVRAVARIDPLPKKTIAVLEQVAAHDSDDVRLAALEDLDRLRVQTPRPKPK
jgi:hypothetical protein